MTSSTTTTTTHNPAAWPGLHLVKRSPAGVPPVAMVTALIDADAGVCDVVCQCAPGADPFIAGRATACLGLRHAPSVRWRLDGRSVPFELVPLLRRVQPLTRAWSALAQAVLRAAPRPASALPERPAAWFDGYRAAMEELRLGDAYAAFTARMLDVRPYAHVVSEFVREGAAGGNGHG